MPGTIRFMPDGAGPVDAAARHPAAAAAVHRYVPHVVGRGRTPPGAPLMLVLPDGLSVRELAQRAARERVEFATGHDPATPDRVIELHYAHLSEAEIEEGVRRLGRCVVRYLLQAARSNSCEPSFVEP